MVLALLVCVCAGDVHAREPLILRSARCSCEQLRLLLLLLGELSG